MSFTLFLSKTNKNGTLTHYGDEKLNFKCENENEKNKERNK